MLVLSFSDRKQYINLGFQNTSDNIVMNSLDVTEETGIIDVYRKRALVFRKKERFLTREETILIPRAGWKVERIANRETEVREGASVTSLCLITVSVD